MEKVVVDNPFFTVSVGAKVKLTPDQAKSRLHNLVENEVKKRVSVYEVAKNIMFKRGEVFGIDEVGKLPGLTVSREAEDTASEESDEVE